MKIVLRGSSEEIDVAALALIHGWRLEQELPAGIQQPRQVTWRVRDGETAIIYVEDALLSTRYIIVRGPSASDVAQKLINGLEVVDLQDLEALRDRSIDPEKAIQLINAAALLAPEVPNDAFAELLIAGMTHHDTQVQRAAVFAITYVPWRRFRESLTKLVASDVAIARDAEVIIQTLDRQGWI